MLSFFVFGAVLLSLRLGEINGTVLLHALLSLKVVRMIPVAIAMLRSDLNARTQLFVGWFGLRVSFTCPRRHDCPRIGTAQCRVNQPHRLGHRRRKRAPARHDGMARSKAYAVWLDRESARNTDTTEGKSIEHVARRTRRRREWTDD